MKRKFSVFTLLLFFTLSLTASDYLQYVNPLMGTQSVRAFSTGNLYPATAMPWGMNFWTPQTGPMGDGWAYIYGGRYQKNEFQNKIRGFKQTHQPSPWINDYGQFSLMPLTGRAVFNEDKRASWFSHKAEVSRPNFYKVYLADYDVTAEITPTERAAMFRFTFPKSDSSFVVIDAFDKGSFIKIIPEQNKVVGYTTRNNGGVPDNFKNYFEVVFDKPFTYRAVVENGQILPSELSKQCNHAGAIIGFSTKKGEIVHARVASSFISHEQATLNMKELGNKGFDRIKTEGENRWNEVLGKIEVSGGSEEQMKTFYTCLYRSLLFPRKFYEFDSQSKPIHYSPYNGEVKSGYLYTDTGFWDTFRSLFPLLNLVYPSVNKEIQEGLVNAYRESGFYPEWASPGHRDCMVGNNSASVLADAFIKGVRVDNPQLMYEGLQHATKAVHPTVSSTGRKGWEYYNKLGYVPYNVGVNENAARTLEYAYNDWCILQVAKKLGRPASEIKELEKRAMNYKNLFDKESKLMRGRNEDGTFQTPFSPLKWGDAFTEGNSWHYTWSVFHDPQGLIDLMGGRLDFVSMLDSVFTIPPVFDASYYGSVIHEIREMQVMNMGNYAHGNQPIQHMIYLYNYAGEPWKAQYWLREVMDRMYKPTPDGYCGDEDNGQTSSWYVFSALGFYPVCPATDQYVMGAPLFKQIRIQLENGKSITIQAPKNNAENRYLKAVKLNNKPYTPTYLTHRDLLNGAVLNIEMSSKPDTMRIIKTKDLPYSFSTAKSK